MSDHKRRIQTINALLHASVLRGNSPLFDKIVKEFKGVGELRKIKHHPRKRLLQVLHSTRGLDSTLAEFIKHYKYTSSARSLGAYLSTLEKPPQKSGLSSLSKDEKEHFKKYIVDIRNEYMHQAGRYPANDHEILALLSEMETCLVRVLAL